MCSSQAKHQPSLSNSLIFTISKFRLMKKTYIQPSMFAVTLQHKDNVLESVSQVDGGDTGIGGGGDGGDLGADVKGSKSIWDEEW